MAPPSPSPANNALRTPHGMSGLFDTGLAGDAKLGALPAQSSELTSATTTDILPTIDTADLLGTGDFSLTADLASLPEVDFLQEGNCGEVDLLRSINTIKSEHHDLMTAEGDDNVFYPNEAATGFNEDSFLGSVVNSDFLEQFTDLSSYSNDGMTGSQVQFDPDQFMKEMAAIEDAAESVVAPMTIKRSVSEAFDEETEVPVVNPDHNHYTRKSSPVRPLKRARTATVTSESDAESVVSSTSFAVVPSSKDNKYLERRRKNNIASRRSRETRKQKFVNMDRQADELEAKNAKLRIKVAELEKLTKIMKDILVAQVANAGKATSAAKS